MKTVQVSFNYPEKLSRGILLLKTFLGFLICIPHFACLFVLGFASGFVSFIGWLAVLFTGKYPEALFNFMAGLFGWNLRVWAYLGLLRDEYPSFGFKADYPVQLKVNYPDKLSRGLLLLRTFFSWIYVFIPHGFCLFFRFIANGFITFIAWWAILITGKMPESMFRFLSGTMRWSANLNAYLFFLTDEYPPFSGKDPDGGTTTVNSGVSA
jgi:hypothetical protein